MTHPIRDARGLAATLAALALLAVAPSALRAQEGGTPPPAEPPKEEEPAAPATPQSLDPAAKPVAPGMAGSRGPSAFTWGDSTGIVLPPLADVRTPAELDAQYEVWKNTRAGAESQMLKARERSLRWKSQVEMQKTSIELLGKQADLAKKEKREADKKDLEASKKVEEKKRAYFESMRQTMDAMAEFNKAQFDLAQARMLLIEQERKLHEAWSKGYEGRVSSEGRSAETRVLTMLKDQASNVSNLASKERALADRALETLKLWSQLNP